MGWENVVLLIANSENSYRELGSTFSRNVWRGLVLGDYFADIRNSLRLLARDPTDALAVFASVWTDVLRAFQAGPIAAIDDKARAGDADAGVNAGAGASSSGSGGGSVRGGARQRV